MIEEMLITFSLQQPLAKQILEQFQAHPKAWERVDQILEQSELIESRVRFWKPFLSTRWNQVRWADFKIWKSLY
jgi:hypothetical protein